MVLEDREETGEALTASRGDADVCIWSREKHAGRLALLRLDFGSPEWELLASSWPSPRDEALKSEKPSSSLEELGTLLEGPRASLLRGAGDDPDDFLW